MVETLPSYADLLYADIKPSYSDSLMHHGIKGMHWGVRRYQNPDGTLTPLGKKQYNKNRKYIDGVRKTTRQYIDANEKSAVAFRTGAKEVREHGVNTAMKLGYSRETAEKSARILANERDRYAQMGEEIVKSLKDYDTKISQIDLSAQSYRETKKLVRTLASKAESDMNAARNAYLTSEEHMEYVRNSHK